MIARDLQLTRPPAAERSEPATTQGERRETTPATHWCPRCDRGFVVRAGVGYKVDSRNPLCGRAAPRRTVDVLTGQPATRCPGCEWRIQIPQLSASNPRLRNVAMEAAATLATYQRTAEPASALVDATAVRYRATPEADAIRNRFIGTRERWLTTYVRDLEAGKYGPADQQFIDREFQINRRAIDAAKAQPADWWLRRAHLDPERDNWLHAQPGDGAPTCANCGSPLSVNRLAVLGWVDGGTAEVTCADCDPRLAERAAA